MGNSVNICICKSRSQINAYANPEVTVSAHVLCEGTSFIVCQIVCIIKTCQNIVKLLKYRTQLSENSAQVNYKWWQEYIWVVLQCQRWRPFLWWQLSSRQTLLLTHLRSHGTCARNHMCQMRSDYQRGCNLEYQLIHTIQFWLKISVRRHSLICNIIYQFIVDRLRVPQWTNTKTVSTEFLNFETLHKWK